MHRNPENRIKTLERNFKNEGFKVYNLCKLELKNLVNLINVNLLASLSESGRRGRLRLKIH